MTQIFGKLQEKLVFNNTLERASKILLVVVMSAVKYGDRQE